MIELLVIWLAGFCIGVAIGIVALWLTSPRCNYRPRRPEQPLAADLIRYTRWRDEQIRRAVTEPLHFDEGLVQRGNGSGGPTTPKPEIVPGFHGPRRTVRWFINNPVQIAECGGPCTVGPTHCDCGALWVDVPTKPQFPSPRKIREDFLP